MRCEDQLGKLENDLKAAEAIVSKAMNDARLKFNKQAAGVMKEIGLKGFKEFRVDEKDKKFQAVIVRSKDGREFHEKLGELSSSEAAAMRILMAFAAKQAYLPYAPVFAMDTITTSLDRDRFVKLLEYLQGKVPFLVATWLSPEHDQVTVVHSIASLG